MVFMVGGTVWVEFRFQIKRPSLFTTIASGLRRTVLTWISLLVINNFRGSLFGMITKLQTIHGEMAHLNSPILRPHSRELDVCQLINAR